MRKLSILLFAVVACQISFAGGIVTNTNQSAMFTRMQARDATLGIDATYYNPAGMSLMPKDGFFLSLNSQTIGQTRNIDSDYQYLNDGKYVGDVSAPVFPSIYAAWKKGNFAISAGFNPIGGGGGGTYETGLPSFEYSAADLVPGLESQGVTAYSLDAYLKGTSVMFGYQLNVSYKINDFISVALGGRYVTAKETYEGYLRDIMINPGGGSMVSASGFFSSISAVTGGVAQSMQPLIDGGAGDLPLSSAPIPPDDLASIEAGLRGMGLDPATLTVAQAQGAYEQSSVTAAATGSLLVDQTVDAEKTATGFTPIISVHLTPTEKLNISLKYEFNTKLEFTNKTTSDVTTGIDENGVPITMFPNNAKTNLDIPSQLVIGATYRPVDPLLISAGFHLYGDKNANWDGRQDSLDANLFELALGLEYSISEKFLVSAGYLYTKTGATGAYQKDLSFSMPSSTIGGGFAYQVLPMLEINLGGSYTMYKEGNKNIPHDTPGEGPVIIAETYDKDVWIVALGLNFNFGATK